MRARLEIGLALASAAILLTLAWVSPAGASVTIGNTLEAVGFGGTGCGGACRLTFFQTVPTTGNRSYASPIDGTIVRWRIQTIKEDTPGTTIWLRVLRTSDGKHFTGAGTSAPQTLSAENGIQTNPASLPIKAGQYIGLDWGSTGAANAYFNGAKEAETTGSVQLEFNPALGDGEAPQEPVGAPGAFEPCASSCGALVINADVAALPTSSASLPSSCAPSGAARVSVSSDPDPATPPKAVHYRIDAGAEQALATVGNPGVTTINVPAGAHTLEYWGEDGAGGVEASHHVANLLVGPCLVPKPPGSAGPSSLVPLISAPRLSASTFRAASQGASLASRLRLPIGTTVSYQDSMAATTTFTVLRHAPGHRKGRKCAAGRPRKHQRRCTRSISLGSFTHADTVGSNSLHFTGRMGGRKLKPGRYTLTMTPKANGISGTAVSLAFRIVP
jgi:hypothetical protein